MAYGSFILESEQELSFDNLEYLGKTIEEYQIRILDRETSTVLSGKEMEKEWLEVLAPIFPYEYQEEKKKFILWIPV